MNCDSIELGSNVDKSLITLAVDRTDCWADELHGVRYLWVSLFKVSTAFPGKRQ
jgi:hypothetical protein